MTALFVAKRRIEIDPDQIAGIRAIIRMSPSGHAIFISRGFLGVIRF
jgi:hypothetical protein